MAADALAHCVVKSSTAIDQSYKSQHALDTYPTMHHYVTEMCTHVHISVTKLCIVIWDLCIMGIVH